MSEQNVIIMSMLTTFDNPYNPFENYDDWYRFDNDHKYDSCGKLAREMACIPDELVPSEEVKLTESAIDNIVKNDVLNRYTKVQKLCPI